LPARHADHGPAAAEASAHGTRRFIQPRLISEVALFSLIGDAAKMQAKVNRINEAAKHAEVANQKKDSASR
jgi:hypothetical protein